MVQVHLFLFFVTLDPDSRPKRPDRWWNDGRTELGEMEKNTARKPWRGWEF